MNRCVCVRLMTVLMAGLSLTPACGSKSPTESTPAPKSNISITSIAVTAEALSSGGYTYRVTVKLRESGGVAATIAAIDLAFLRDSTTLASLRVDRPISDAANVVAANATVDSREMTTTDSDPSHPAATSVMTKVTFTDSAATTSSATASAEIAAPAAITYTLSGTVSDESNARMLAGGTVQIVDGANAGKTAATDGGGAYSLSGLAAGSFMVRATVNGYTPAEQRMTIARDATLDLKLRAIVSAPPPAPAPAPPATPCAYTVTPTDSQRDYNGGNLTAAISRTSGSCSWSATSDVNWITFGGPASGDGSATLAYTVGSNPSFSSRTGHITISWASGSAQIRVFQGNHPDWECDVSVSAGPQDFNNVPSTGSQLTVSLRAMAIPPEWSPQCAASVSASVPWISGSGSHSGGNAMPATVTFTVAPNPSPGTPRTGSIVATGGSRTRTLTVTQR